MTETRWEELPGHDLSDEEFLEEFFMQKSSSGIFMFFSHERPTWTLYARTEGGWKYWTGGNGRSYGGWDPMNNERMRRRLIMVAFPEVVE